MDNHTHCPNCGTPYKKRKRCYKCTGTPSTKIECICQTCGLAFYKQPNDLKRGKGKFCSRSCASKSRTGKKSGKWKGGYLPQTNGYIKITLPSIGTVFEHRYIMEQHIGRKLNAKEQVHHKNGNRSDNRIDNLLLVSTAKEHMTYHNLPRPSRLKGRWSFNYSQCVRCGTIDSPHWGKGLCLRCYHFQRRHPDQAESLISTAKT